MTVVKDSGERALLPPFTDEHIQLRETINRWVKAEIVPNVDDWERAGEFPRELYSRAAELGFLGLKYPVELGGQGGDYVHDAVWAEELAAAGASGGVGAGLGAHTGIATPPIHRLRHPRSARTLPAPGDRRRADRGARNHRAWRRLRRRVDPHLRPPGRRRVRGQRVKDLHHQRGPRRLPGLRREDDRVRWPPGDLVPDPRARDARLRGRDQAREDGLALVRHRRALVQRCRGPGREPARRGEPGLLSDHGELRLGAAADVARRRGGDAAAARGRARLLPRARGVRTPDRPAFR